MVEHAAVNRRVVSSSLTRGANETPFLQRGFLFMEYYLYILESKSTGIHYTGISQNPHKRLGYHNSVEKGFTSRYRPWEIVFTKRYESKEAAMLVERKIKSWKSKKMIEKVIRGDIVI